jgi:hypothetical protein
VAVSGCGGRESGSEGANAKKATAGFSQIKRADFNRRAAELYLPLFWRNDDNGDGVLDPGELTTILGVDGPGLADYVAGGQFTEQFVDAYRQMSARPNLSGLAPAEQKRQQAVLDELAQGRPTLVDTDLRSGSAEDKALVEHVLAAAATIEKLYAKQMGTFALASQVPAEDTASRMLTYRNHGPFCHAPKTEANPDCNALASRPKKISGLYPAEFQNGTDTRFCTALERRADASDLLGPFTVVSIKSGSKPEGNPATDELQAVPYSTAYKAEMEEVSSHLMSAAAAITDPNETPLKLYLATAADSFLSNDWQPADEAWARMNATNSKWYLRIAPDEVYEDPCSRKGLFQVSFARINPDGLEWQRKLEPRKADMEAALAKLAGPPYEARPVTFHLPDFIDIVLNAGESRDFLGAAIGESLPNWGPVANEGRGRTVAMVNLYTDADSEAAWKTTTSSVFCARTMEKSAFDPKAGVMSSVLHEAAHNLGPAHEYRVAGRTDAEIFGGPLASMLEELKAQTSALYFTDWLFGQGVIDQPMAERAHLKDVTWAFGHIAEGMYDAEGKPKPYSQLSAIQMGALFGSGVLAWRAAEPAANRADKGCFNVDLAQWPAAIEKLETRVLHIKAAGDERDAQALLAEFVDAKDDWAKARDVIRDRYLRNPRASFVYAIER